MPRGRVVTGRSDDGGRECSKCGVYKPWESFRPLSHGHRGYSSWCRACGHAGDRALQKSKGYRNCQHMRSKGLLQYGLTIEDYDRMITEQAGLCAICKSPETTTRSGQVRRLSVDHCHKSGRVRGLLCNQCNTAIGLLRDDPDLLVAAAGYLGRDMEGSY